MDYRSKPCIFLGYSCNHKGYKCLDSTGRIYIVKHVVLDEFDFPIHSKIHEDLSCHPTSSNTHPSIIPIVSSGNLKEVVYMKPLEGELHYFLGIEAKSLNDGKSLLSQSKYASNLLHKLKMQDTKRMKTPLAPGCKFQSKRTKTAKDPSLYRSVVSVLQYLTITRPDLAFTINKLCQYMHKSLQIKRVLRYINGTRDHGILFEKSNNLHIIGYYDSDWAFDQDDMRSTTSGYCLFLGNNMIFWMAKKQQVVSRSGIEAEYDTLCNDPAGHYTSNHRTPETLNRIERVYNYRV
uniref:Retroviral polymerase SH3-like domain-containing protein n=1 Tax=Cajanus cajan TaxID=3821 RepID=A0A151QR28_CAJCA|nr:hypothetical protein KK1_046449 [Cajanus cajan]